MRRILASALAIALAIPHPAGAQIAVECPLCSSVYQQLQDAVTQAKEYATQLLQYKSEFDSYIQLVTAGVQLPMSIFQGIQADIGQVRALANAASMLTGNAGGILSRLQSAEGYANQATMLPGQIGSQFTMWQQTIATANNSLARVVGVQQGQMQSATATMAQIQAHSAGAAGQMQAIQAGNEMAAQTVYALQQVQTTLAAAATAQGNRDIVAAERQAAHDQASLQFFQYQPIATTGSQGF
jgi:P-type conjugative transfer protein TrbJ